MHVLSVTIHEIAMQLGTAKPDPSLWHSDSAARFTENIEAIIHDLLALSTQLQVN